MKDQRDRLQAVAASWQRAGPTPRLLAGALVVIAIGFVGLSPRSLLGIELAWPYAGLCAAIGWSRIGLSLRPMLVLVILGLAQDISFNAPLGSFTIVNLMTYGAHAAASETLELERDPVMGRFASLAGLAFGFLVVWLIASALSGEAVRVMPLLAAWISTVLIYTLIHPVFDLRPRSTGREGGF